MDLLPIEESSCYRHLCDRRIVDSEPFRGRVINSAIDIAALGVATVWDRAKNDGSSTVRLLGLSLKLPSASVHG